jgi:serine/threonine protein kinase
VAKAVEIDGHDNATAQVIRVLSVERMSSMPRGRPYTLGGPISPRQKSYETFTVLRADSSVESKKIARWSMPQYGFFRYAGSRYAARFLPHRRAGRPQRHGVRLSAPPTCGITARSPSRFPTPTWKPIPVLFDRFQRESGIGEKLSHPKVMRVYGGEERSRVYMVMEWCEGRLLRQIISRRPHPA